MKCDAQPNLLLIRLFPSNHQLLALIISLLRLDRITVHLPCKVSGAVSKGVEVVLMSLTADGRFIKL